MTPLEIYQGAQAILAIAQAAHDTSPTDSTQASLSAAQSLVNRAGISLRRSEVLAMDNGPVRSALLAQYPDQGWIELPTGPIQEELDKAKSRKRAADWDDLRDELFAENRARLRGPDPEFSSAELVEALDSPQAQAVFSALRQLAFEIAILRIASLEDVNSPVFDEAFRERWAAKLTAIL
jgi:hypothetical protein